MIMTTNHRHQSITKNQEGIRLGEMISTRHPENYHLLGIGSCLGIFMYDLTKPVYFIAHTLLPEFDHYLPPPNPKMPAKFTDMALFKMLERLELKGSMRSNIQCKIVGGAQIYRDKFNIGTRNIQIAKKILQEKTISIIAEDVGGHTSRSILAFNPDGTINMRKQGRYFII